MVPLVVGVGALTAEERRRRRPGGRPREEVEVETLVLVAADDIVCVGVGARPAAEGGPALLPFWW